MSRQQFRLALFFNTQKPINSSRKKILEELFKDDKIKIEKTTFVIEDIQENHRIIYDGEELTILAYDVLYIKQVQSDILEILELSPSNIVHQKTDIYNKIIAFDVKNNGTSSKADMLRMTSLCFSKMVDFSLMKSAMLREIGFVSVYKDHLVNTNVEMNIGTFEIIQSIDTNTPTDISECFEVLEECYKETIEKEILRSIDEGKKVE